jgi:hypothetical protein
MFENLKGKFIAATCQFGDRLPSLPMRERLKPLGWNFRTIEGPAGEEPLYVIVHPDGKPIDGYGSPNYQFSWAATAEKEKSYKDSCKQRWADFAQACAQVKARPAVQTLGLRM